MTSKIKTKIIYEPQGRASEYAGLAANIYTKCTHGCRYCYANKMRKMKKEQFHAENKVKNNAIRDLRKDARKLRELRDDREILFCFMGDPYNPDEPVQGITRQAIEIMIQNNLRFTVLTKGGDRARRDLDLLSHYPKCSLGQTIIFSDQVSADYWEPNAAPLLERFQLAKDAHEMGITTWVSLEPVIDPNQALEVVSLLHPYVDKWKVGPINYQKGIDVDWPQFKNDIVSLFKKVGAIYYLKKELLKKAA